MENNKPRRRYRGLIISSIIIFAILLAGIIWLERLKASQDQNFKRINKIYLTLNKEAEKIEKIKNTRIKFYKNKFLGHMGKKYTYSVANFIRQLGVWANAELIFTELEITPLTQNFSFILKGYLANNNKRYAPVQLQKFYQKLSNYDTLVGINLTRLKAKNSIGDQEVILFFAINGEMETE